MAYRTIGTDCSFTSVLGALVPATQTFGGTPVSLKSILKSIEVTEDLQTTDVNSLGDGLEKLRGIRSKFRVNFKLQIPDTGRTFAAAIGYGIKLAIKPLSSLSTAETYVGMVTNSEMSIEDGENIETVTVMGGIEGYTYTGVYA